MACPLFQAPPRNDMSDCASQPTCFNGHDLKRRVHDSLFYCSMCGLQSTSDISLFSCHMCNFDTCLACTAGTYRKEHSFVALEHANESNLACVECDGPIVGRHFMCNQCEWVMCETCFIACKINSIKIGSQ